MKRLITGLLISLIPTSMFAIGGFGLQLGQNSFSVDASSPETGIDGVTLTNGAFDGSGAFGGYVYIDLIPFVDVEFDFNIQGNTYDIDFNNNFGTPMPTLEFSWLSSNTYTTVRKKVVGLSIPFKDDIRKTLCFCCGRQNNHAAKNGMMVNAHRNDTFAKL